MTVIFGLVLLVESIDVTRLGLPHRPSAGRNWRSCRSQRAPARWTIRTLSVTVLIGAIIGILDLQVRHELTVIKASGHSIWKIMRAPADRDCAC